MCSDQKLLIVDRDTRHLQSRKLILGAYFDAEIATRAVEGRHLLRENRFGLVIFCSTVSDTECAQISDAIDENQPGIRVLRLGSTNFALEGVPCYYLPVEDGPLHVLKVTAELLGFQLRSRGRMVRMLPLRRSLAL